MGIRKDYTHLAGLLLAGLLLAGLPVKTRMDWMSWR